MNQPTGTWDQNVNRVMQRGLMKALEVKAIYWRIRLDTLTVPISARGGFITGTEAAYRVLGLMDPNEEQRRSKATHKFRQDSFSVHPDKLGQSEEGGEVLTRYIAELSLAASSNAYDQVKNPVQVMNILKKSEFNRTFVRTTCQQWAEKDKRHNSNNAGRENWKTAWASMTNEQRNGLAEELFQSVDEGPLVYRKAQAEAYLRTKYPEWSTQAAGDQTTQTAAQAAAAQQAQAQAQAAAQAEAAAAQQAAEAEAEAQAAEAARQAHQQAEEARQELLRRQDERANPTQPQPTLPNEREGLSAIDHLSVETCFIGDGNNHIDIPSGLRGQWASAYSKIIQLVLDEFDHTNYDINNNNINSEETTRALKWFLIIHHILLSSPPRSGKSGQSVRIIERRFQLLNQKKYGTLINLWEREVKNRDSPSPSAEKRKEKKLSKEDQALKNGQKGADLILKGYVSRGVKVVQEDAEKADMMKPTVKSQAKDKHPKRSRENYWDPTDIGDRPALTLNITSNQLRNLDQESAPGASGFSNKMIWALGADSYSDPHAKVVLDRLNKLGELYMNARLPGWFSALFMSVKQIGLDKGKKYQNTQQQDYRFIGIGESLRRLFWKNAYDNHGHIITEEMEPHQLAMGTPSGGQSLAWGCAISIEQNQQFAFVKIDLVNMFGAFWRKTGIETVLNIPRLQVFHRALEMEAYIESTIYVKSGKKTVQADHKYSEGGQQGATSSLILACAALLLPLRRLDADLKIHGGFARFGVDDGVIAGPPNIVYDRVKLFQEECEELCGMKVNYNSTMVYEPSGDYTHKPVEFSIGTMEIKERQQSGEETIVLAEGLTIWGAAVSLDRRYNEAFIAKTAEKINSDIQKVTHTLNQISKDCAMAALKLSLYHRFQYCQQVHLPSQTEAAAKSIQDKLDEALVMILSIDLHDKNSYVIDPTSQLEKVDVNKKRISLAARDGGLGLRRMDDFVADAAFVSAISQCTSRFIDKQAQTGETMPGLFQHLEPLFGVGSQDQAQSFRRFHQFTSGNRSLIGRAFQTSWWRLQEMVTDRANGPLADDVSEVGTAYRIKLQNKISKQIEAHRLQKLEEEFNSLPQNDRRVLAWKNTKPSTLTFLTTTPTVETQFGQKEFVIAACLVFGAIHPWVREHVGSSIGNQKTPLDVHGDALGTVRIAGDRWRRCHDAPKTALMGLAKICGVIAQMEVYGMFLACMSLAGRTAYSNLSREEKSRQCIVPDIVTRHYQSGSPLATNGDQMWEIKRVHGVLKCKANGTTEINNYYCGGRKGVERREQQIPAEYNSKAKMADRNFGEPGSTSVYDHLKTLPEVKGLAIGAFGELSNNFDLLISGFAQEGAQNNSTLCGTRDLVSAKGQIAWWMKKRLGRIAVNTAAQCRMDAMRYVGGKAQAAADAFHTSREEAEDWAYDRERTRREYEAARGPPF